MANPSPTAATVNFTLTTLSGTSLGLTGRAQVPAQGHIALFLNQIQGFAGLPTPFKGVLRISSSSTQISVIGLRLRYNERHDLLTTTTPPVDETSPPSTAGLYFPQLADGGGYTTQFVLFSGTAGQSSSGTLQLYSQSGQSLGLTLSTAMLNKPTVHSEALVRFGESAFGAWQSPEPCRTLNGDRCETHDLQSARFP